GRIRGEGPCAVAENSTRLLRPAGRPPHGIGHSSPASFRQAPPGRPVCAPFQPCGRKQHHLRQLEAARNGGFAKRQSRRPRYVRSSKPCPRPTTEPAICTSQEQISARSSEGTALFCPNLECHGAARQQQTSGRRLPLSWISPRALVEREAPTSVEARPELKPEQRSRRSSEQQPIACAAGPTLTMQWPARWCSSTRRL